MLPKPQNRLTNDTFTESGAIFFKEKSKKKLAIDRVYANLEVTEALATRGSALTIE